MNEQISSQKVLVLGGRGLVGSRFVELTRSDFAIDSPGSQDLNILEKGSVEKYLQQNHPDVLVNFAAYTQVDKAEDENGDKSGQVYQLNAGIPERLGAICHSNEIHLLQVSTAYVFNGTKSDLPYTEKDLTKPKGWYAQTKYLGEEFVQESGCDFTIIRFDMPFRANFAFKKDIARFFLDQLQQGLQVQASGNQQVTPMFIDDLSLALRELISHHSPGIYHLGSTDPTSPLRMALEIARQFGLNEGLIKEVDFFAFNAKRKAPRPQNSWLDTSKFRQEFGQNTLHSVEDNVSEFKKQVDAIV